ncbi:MAG: 23S rRNA (uracil(1939)-C(5))-methyltransferase RlmD [Acetatifactor sp.]|nr:23S rRNA (uracil(1939)-C(5))-methyltransferase RlmD [Acetatifactor sp.]
MKYRKNDSVTVTIEDLGTEGEGIGKVDGFTLFVKDAVPGDTVEAKIMKSKKNYAYARLEKVTTPSPFRVEPRCAFHRQCGGCQLQTLSYEKQLEFKQQKIRNNLIRIGGFLPEYIDERMEPIIGMEEPFYYRNKAQYPVGTDRDGNIITGFYAGRTHSIIANTECHLGALENREVLEVILKHMRRYNVPAYDETTGKGLVRHVLIRKGFTSGEIMVCLVINKMFHGRSRGRQSCSASGQIEFIPEQNILLKELAAIKGMTSVSVSINTERTNVIMGKEIHTLWGSTVISDTIHVRDMRKEGYPFTGKELTFHISPLSFYQVNPMQTEKLYSLALEYAGLTGEETVWDLYCGIGTISLFLAGNAKKVYGVEIIPQAIDDARENAKRNDIRNAEFFVGKAEEVLPGFYERGSGSREVEIGETEAGDVIIGKARVGDIFNGKAEVEDLDFKKLKCEDVKTGESEADMLHPDVIVVDPPRKGCDEACLNTMLKMNPNRIVYVSCDSATLSRDLKVLCDGGYEIVKVRGVDQFGMTTHTECVVWIQRKHI